MPTNILVPALGESVVEATVGKWLKQEGDAVSAGEPLVELETDKVNLAVPAEKAGVLSHIERKEGEDGRYHVVERSYGSFMRSFTLPQGVDENQIQAEFENGILSVRIRKAALPQPKRIQISANQQKQQGSVGSGKRDNEKAATQSR